MNPDCALLPILSKSVERELLIGPQVAVLRPHVMQLKRTSGMAAINWLRVFCNRQNRLKGPWGMGSRRPNGIG
jgi:hypothetical protein